MIPNHVLILGPPNSGKLRISDLISRGDANSARSIVQDESHSGIIQTTSLTTKYYTVKLKLMIDEYPSKRTSSITDDEYISALQEWKRDFFTEEMGELREALDGIIFTYNMNTHPQFLPNLLLEVDEIRAKLEQLDNWDGFLSVVGTVPFGEAVELYKMDAIEDEVITHGIEFINFEKSGINEYKERVGRDRLLELFETHGWSNMELLERDHSKYEKNKVKKLEGMQTRLLNGTDRGPDLEDMFSKISLARENASNLPPEQREKYAKEMVDEFMEFL
ncbi:IRC6 [Candida theae]|uniref:Increased recombination centers protein 6 n=1 Tax=Candida theae TaxID=1198502 RepID=A0AAD5BCD7_9ASCO|nr:IRC6 [Candida theae]KAI5953034.1 IRC6 [Candida theae]